MTRENLKKIIKCYEIIFRFGNTFEELLNEGITTPLDDALGELFYVIAGDFESDEYGDKILSILDNTKMSEEDKFNEIIKAQAEELE